MTYIPPKNDNVFFEFGSSGYIPPDFNDVNFKFDTYSVSNIKMMISGSELQRDYLKDCRTYVLGYDRYNIQILRHSCTYGGIRDLYFDLKTVRYFREFPAYIKPTIEQNFDIDYYIKSKLTSDYSFNEVIKGIKREVEANVGLYIKTTIEESLDIEKYLHTFQNSSIKMLFAIKSWYRKLPTDVSAYIRAFHIEDIGAYTKIVTEGTYDVRGLVKGYASSTYEFNEIIKGIKTETKDVDVYLKSLQTSYTDLNQYVHLIHNDYVETKFDIKIWFRRLQKDMLTVIRCFHSEEVDVPSYIKPTIQLSSDFNLDIFKIWQHNNATLKGIIHGWQTYDLLLNIRAFQYSDLYLTIRSTYTSDIIAILLAIEPVDMGFDLMGWQDMNLVFDTNIVSRPGDFTFYAYGIPAVDLPVEIIARKGIEVPYDIRASITSYYTETMPFKLFPIEPSDINMSITSRGYTNDLLFKIYPKVVYVKTYIIVSYLESRDISFSVNYPCFNSKAFDLGFNISIPHSSSVVASIFGYDGCNIQDFSFSVNHSSYIEQNMLPIKALNVKQPSSSIKLLINKAGCDIQCDTMSLLIPVGRYNSVNYVRNPNNLIEGCAARAVEEYPNVVQETVPEYKINMFYWEVKMFCPYNLTTYSQQYYVSGSTPVDGDTSTYVASYDTHTNSMYIQVKVVPKTTITKFYHKTASSGGDFSANHLVYVKENEEDDWTFIKEHYTAGTSYVEKLVDCTGFDKEIGWIKIYMVPPYHGIAFYEVYGLTNIPPYTDTSNLKIHHDFESSLDSYWNSDTQFELLPSPVVEEDFDQVYTAKSFIIDMSNNYGAGQMGLRSIEFKTDSGPGTDHIMINIEASDITAYASSTYDLNYCGPHLVFITSISKTGGAGWRVAATEWRSHSSGSPITNQRLICVFNNPIEFKHIVLNNSHSYGGGTTIGVHAIKLYTSSDIITDTVYGSSISNSELIFDWSVRRHVSIDVVDDQLLAISKSYNSGFNTFGSNGTTLTNDLEGYATWTPKLLETGRNIELFEYSYFAEYNSISFPVLYLLANNGNRLFSLSVGSSGELVMFYNHSWEVLSAPPTSGLSSWYTVRALMDWQSMTFDLFFIDKAANDLQTFTVIPMNELSIDLCVDGTAFSSPEADSVGYNTSCANAFNDNLSSDGRGGSWDGLAVTYPTYIGYNFNTSHVLKLFRLRIAGSTTGDAPYNFEIRAANSRPSGHPAHTTDGDVLYSADESSNSSYWSPYEWKDFVLDNPENKEYSVCWLVSYGNYNGNYSMYITEIEIMGLINEQDYIPIGYGIHLHDVAENGSWCNGWDGTSSTFRVDDVILQDIYYKEIIDRGQLDVNFTINGTLIPIDMPFGIRVIKNVSRNDTTVSNNVVVLHLDRGISDWRRYVELTFRNYAQSYTYFSGNARAYKDYSDDHWEVRVEGYSLSNLPKGVDKTKVRNKYLFNLGKYKSFDEAVRHMITRVTEFCESDFNFGINVIQPIKSDVSFSIKGLGEYKSNRKINFVINGV